MKDRGIGWAGAIAILVVGSLVLGYAASPRLQEEVDDFFGGIEESSGPPEIDFGELSETYEADYISQYLWNNYENQEIKISKVETVNGETSNRISDKEIIKGLDYIFVVGF